MQHHSQPISNINYPRSISHDRGKYGRIFPWLPPQAKDTIENREKMKELANIMREYNSKIETKIPAGYTYLGQFLAHDMTFDPSSISNRQMDPEFLENFRSPALDLDSIYGGGPLINPYLYEPINGHHRVKFFLDKQTEVLPIPCKPKTFWDLPRLKNEQAVIADPRNDEHLIIAQLHTCFLYLHNHFLDELDDNKFKGLDKFHEAQRLLRWHYQYLIIHDYLPQLIDKNIIDLVMDIRRGKIGKKEIFKWRNNPFIPLEFSGAIFRFGHSMVRDDYTLNEHYSGVLFGEEEDRIINLAGNKSAKTYINWSNFFENSRNNAKLISQSIPDALFKIPDAVTKIEKNLAYRNLLKGLKLELPSGQTIAKAMGLDENQILNKQEIAKGKIAGEINASEYDELEKLVPEFLDNTPLWYYILLEARYKGKGTKLGPVAARIIAEVIIGLIMSDKNSYFHQEPNWEPHSYLDGQGNQQKVDNFRELFEMAGIYEGLIKQ